MRVELNGSGELHIYSESELETYALTHWSKDNPSENGETKTAKLIVHPRQSDFDERYLVENGVA